MMDRAIKQRILGTLVLLAGSAALAPLVLDGSGTIAPREVSLPPRPVVASPPPVSTMTWSAPSTPIPAPVVNEAPTVTAPADSPAAGVPVSTSSLPGAAASAEPAVRAVASPSVAQANVNVAAVRKPRPDTHDDLQQETSLPHESSLPDLPKAWTVQVASLASADAARALRSELLRRGYPVYQRELGSAYKVFVGPELDKAKAQSFKERLAKEGYAGWMQAYNVH